MKIFPKKEKMCEHDEYCPIYLSYALKYGDESPEVKICKNSNKQYCIKYRLIEESEWKKISKEEKLKVITKMNLIDFIDRK